MRDLFTISFWKKNGQKATITGIGGYSSWDAIDSVKQIFKDDFTELCEFPTKIENSNNH